MATLAQLNVIRYDLNANGQPTGGGTTAYNAAFPNCDANAATRMGCPSGACTGYEPVANLDFDTNNDGSVTTTGDSYWNGGNGWAPIGSDANANSRYEGDFKGNGHTINNLFIDRSGTNDIGLFGGTHTTSRIETLGVTNANVTGNQYVGILSSNIYGYIVAYYTTGKARGTHGTSGTQGSVGGLVGWASNGSSVSSSYSTASVTRNVALGGLAGQMRGSLTNSYSTGRVTRLGGNAISHGGLLGWGGGVTASYWDTTSSGYITSYGGSGAVGKTPRELQTPLATPASTPT